MDSSVKSKPSQALILFKHCKKLFLMSVNKKKQDFDVVGGYLYPSFFVKVPNVTTITMFICQRRLLW